MFKLNLSKFKKKSSDKMHTILASPEGHEFKIAHAGLKPEHREQLARLPMAKAMDDGGEVSDPNSSSKGPKLDPNKVKAFQQNSMFNSSGEKQAPKDEAQSKAKGGDVKAMADGGEQYASQMPDPNQDPTASLPAETSAPVAAPQVPADVEAKRSLYNQHVQSMSNTPGDPREQERIKAQIFGPNGQPPANFNVMAWNKADSDYGAQQNAETAAKTAATEQMVKANEARTAAGLSPIPVTADDAASITPGSAGQGGLNTTASAPTTPQTPADNAIPGDAELKSLQNGRSAVSAANPNSAPAAQLSSGAPQQAHGMSPEQTAQALVGAKQMSYKALMQERQRILSSMTDVKAKTMGDIWDSKDLPGKLGMIAGMLLGGAGAGLTGKDNPVITQYQSMIDNDLKAQSLNLGKKQSLLSNNLALTGDIRDATMLAKVNANDLMMHHIVQLAQKYPNNPKIQQQLQALGQLGVQSSGNMMDTVAANLAWRHSVSEIKDPAQKINFNPIMTPEQKNEAMKQLQTFQNMKAARTNVLAAFDKVSGMGTMSRLLPAGRAKEEANIEPLLGQIVKDSDGRITPTDLPLMRSMIAPSKLPNATGGKGVRDEQRQALAKFMSSKMNFPMLQFAGVDTLTPQIGAVPTAKPKIGK